jgi:glycosyltransferase involved in cell wall biosynthesis
LSRPLVSTVIAAYNAAETIAQTLASALAQDWNNHEIVVVNDGSTDNTRDILDKYRGRISIVDQSNRGAAFARNAGVTNANGKYIAFLDADDSWLPTKLSIMVPLLERAPAASLAFSEYYNVSEDGLEYEASSLGRAPSLQEMMAWLPPILTSTWIVPRDVFQRAGGYSTTFRGGQGFEDSWMLLQLRELGAFVYVAERLTRYRIAVGSESADKYSHALGTFTSLARSRYGKRSRQLVRAARNLQCRWTLSKVARQMNRNERLGALNSLVRIMRIRPAYLFEKEFLGRLLLPQNRRRIRQFVHLASAS